jgi:hypothetical protein
MSLESEKSNSSLEVELYILVATMVARRHLQASGNLQMQYKQQTNDCQLTGNNYSAGIKTNKRVVERSEHLHDSIV